MDKSQLEQIEREGYVVFKNVFSKEEIKNFRDVFGNFFNTQASLHWTHNATDVAGKMFPGWVGSPYLLETSKLAEDNRITDKLDAFYGGKSWIFMGHSDLHQNINTPVWHRDSVNLVTDFENDKVVKVCILLQDHLDGETGLWMKPKSHLDLNWRERGTVCADLPSLHLDSEETDLIMFNQNTIHKGQDGNPSYFARCGKHRYLITFGYGVDNEYTKRHADVTIERQLQQQSEFQ